MKININKEILQMVYISTLLEKKHIKKLKKKYV